MMSKHKVSRRQFLNYTLTGVGGFMAAGILMPMVRFAVDPVLKAQAEETLSQLIKRLRTLQVNQFVWILVTHRLTLGMNLKSRILLGFTRMMHGNIVALSPVCKHLGCTVDWNTDREIQINSSVRAITAVYKKMV